MIDDDVDDDDHYALRQSLCLIEMAETQAIPILGMNLSMAFGQNMMAWIHDQFNMKAAWIVSGACVALYLVFFIFAFMLVGRRSPEKSLSSEQQKVKLEMGGAEIDKFVEAL